MGKAVAGAGAIAKKGAANAVRSKDARLQRIGRATDTN